jgi:hypothetical protein
MALDGESVENGMIASEAKALLLLLKLGVEDPGSDAGLGGGWKERTRESGIPMLLLALL